MTEVDFSRLLSKLSTTAKDLNEKSDSINDVIRAFEEKLRDINLGIEVWLDSTPLDSKATFALDDEGAEDGSVVEELGFSKLVTGEWALAVRRAFYDLRASFRSANVPVRLIECSRRLRIEALKQFPTLVGQMTTEATEAIRAIDAARSFVAR
jgi:hypothetical protein